MRSRKHLLALLLAAVALGSAAARAPAQDADPGRARFITAVTRFHEGDYDGAIETLRPLTERAEPGAWFRKARFLEARALIELRRFPEAEAIYESEARRLLGESRKEDIARVILEFADALAKKADPDDPGAPKPDYKKAHNLYRRVLEMEIGRGLRDRVMFRSARVAEEAGDHAGAIAEYRAYLMEYDPDWTGPVGSPGRLANQKRENPPAAGRHALEARYQLAVAQLASQQYADARRNLEDLLDLLGTGEPAALIADTRWQIVLSHFLQPSAADLSLAVHAAESFLLHHDGDPRAVAAAWWIPAAYQRFGRADDAIREFAAFASGERFRLPEGDLAHAKLERFNRSPAEMWDELEKTALYQIAVLRVGQKKYAEAIEAYRDYVNRYPNGPHWAKAQQGIIDAEFQMGLEALADEDHALARDRFGKFLAEYPLDPRARQILFILGQVRFARAEELAEDDAEKARPEYVAAVEEWSRLVGKYPNTEEASLAQYRIGLIHEEKLGDLEAALAAYRKLTWGSAAGNARARIAAMTEKHLELATERTFRTNETPTVTLSVRNIEKLTFRLYSLDLEAYFRKTHGVTSVEALDIALIQPDRTWEVEIGGYRKYAPIEQKVEVPFPENKPGVVLLNVSEDDYEATTLVLRSDLDLIVKSSRREVLVFAADMRKDEPAPGARLLVSDGKEVFATGETGEDGVYRGVFDTLKEAGTLRVFAVRDGNIAASWLNMSGLQLARGLSPKGYVYTDRPAYLPGQKVGVRGILRGVADGSYSVSEGETYSVRVMDSAGRLIWGGERSLSEFGTFDAEFDLDAAAATGGYTVAVSPMKDEKTVFLGGFRVEQFKLEKMSVELSAPRKVYFRGETVELEIAARYYWGEPVADRSVRTSLPDGRSLVGRTDREGVLKVSFDTTGLTPGTVMAFSAEIEGENVRGALRVPLARLGFGLRASASRELVLAGEPFDVTVAARLPDGKPAARKGTLTVLRRETPKPDPVLSGVPWVSRPSRPAAEVTVSEHDFATDEETGEATVRLTLEEGGRYVLRASGEDRFGQVVTSEGAVTISDDEDATKLRFFSKSDTLKVGEESVIRLHSRIESGLALVTFDGEEVLSHRVTRIGKGMHDLVLDVGHEHFPNFRVTAAVMDGRELRTAEKDFKVERRLVVTVKPLSATFEPGSEGRVEITAVDHLGNPVRAELSLSLADEALFARFPDRTPKILDFFQKDAERFAAFRVASTNAFTYRGVTREVVKEILDEAQRRARQSAEAQQLAGLAEQLRRQEQAPIEQSEQSATRRYSGGHGGQYRGPAGEVPPGQRDPGDAQPPPDAAGDHNETDNDAPFNEMDNDAAGFLSVVERNAREDLPAAGHWIASVVTGEDGKAVVEVPMPESTTKWRITTRGTTAETLVGEAVGDVVTRKEFFVTLKVPAALTEGDKVRPLARLHNLTDYEGPAEVVLRVYRGGESGGRLLERRLTASVRPHEMTEALFPEVEVPAETGLRLVVSAKAGPHEDALSSAVPVRPWGIEYSEHGGGLAKSDRTVTLELPKGREYLSRWLTVSVGPDAERAVVEMALGDGARRELSRVAPGGTHPASDLLAVVSALSYATRSGLPQDDRHRLLVRAKSLVGTLVVTQRKDGAWAWQQSDSGAGDDPLTATAFWALTRARQEGLAVNDETLARAQSFLETRFTQLEVTQNDDKAMILHALSVAGKAEFAHLNRLHRERNGLSRPALALTALAFANQGRKDFAGELLDVLLGQSREAAADGRTLRSWEGRDYVPGRGNTSLRFVSDTESTALALLALIAVRPEAPQVRESVDFLLHRRGCFGYVHGRAKGPAVAALAAWFGKGKYAETDSRITLFVNGREIRTFNSRGERPLVSFDVPREQIGDGAAKVEFRARGRGEFTYAATLRGFSKSLEDPKRWYGPTILRRVYYHDNLEYRGRRLAWESTSKVRNVEIGQRVRVVLQLEERKRPHGHMVIEEPIPAGMIFVEGSLTGNSTRHETRDGRLLVYHSPSTRVDSLSYELAGYATGDYRVLPTAVREAMSSQVMRLGKPSALRVLGPGEKSDDTYVLNHGERFELGKLLFEDGRYADALDHLTKLFEEAPRLYERDVARMLLWIYTTEGFYDARKIVAAFEVLRERYPELEIPFDKILVVGTAYRDIGEHERAYLVFKATIDASFLNDSNVSAVLEDEGQFMGSVEYQEELWRQYPDTAEVATAYFALSQALYEKAPKAHELAAEERRRAIARGREALAKPPDRVGMLKEAIRLLESFLDLYPEDPLADDAAFSLANAFLDLKQYEAVVEFCHRFEERFAESDFLTGFQYMTALGYFWQKAYEPALEAARIVGEGESKDRDFARYIVGQIHHAEGNPAEAIEWYRKVEKLYVDAAEAIRYFEEKRISLEEVSVVKPGEPVELTLEYRNIREAAIQVYRVDLMKLYLREKNLSSITKVHLAGIRPELEKTIGLGDGKDYADKERVVKLDLSEEAAYLVICRGDDLFTSGLVLVTPLEIEVQEDAKSGRLRANVIDTRDSTYASEVHVKAIGSEDSSFCSGETDMRGVFVADDLHGTATVIARSGDSRYAFHRGKTWLGPPTGQPGQGGAPAGQRDPQAPPDYQQNLRDANRQIQDLQSEAWNKMRRTQSKGVKVQEAK